MRSSLLTLFEWRRPQTHTTRHSHMSSRPSVSGPPWSLRSHNPLIAGWLTFADSQQHVCRIGRSSACLGALNWVGGCSCCTPFCVRSPRPGSVACPTYMP
ncbi:unnamed protein product [Protopolystoma xenopodis]|uniref:Uncharacterized protein n=1 Tax=Protopolystoma xenopodis TaxID=117903 RepID=A0A3S4ZZD4_9PLAT|nr:unnamed protein product [Protopolystoma xenopodis]